MLRKNVQSLPGTVTLFCSTSESLPEKKAWIFLKKTETEDQYALDIKGILDMNHVEVKISKAG